MKVIFTPFSGSSVIFDQCHMVWRAVAIKLQHLRTCLPHVGDEGMTLLYSCQVLKSLAYDVLFLVASQLIAQLNRFLALQALVEGLGM